MKFVCILAVLGTFIGSSLGANDKVVCYHGSWSTYRNGLGKFTVENIDPTLCTHVIYGFVGLNQDGTIRIMDSWLEVDSGNFQRFVDLKKKNPKLKTLVAIGGWNEGSLLYSQMAADATKRATLINSAVALLQQFGFDGFDLDWEYPGQRGGSSVDIQNYAKLLKEFREKFNQHGYLLSAAVAASGSSVDLSYDVPSLSKYLDFINVMAYDFHGVWDEVTGHNAPLYGNDKLTVDAAIQGWISRGADPQKLVLGLGVYGRSFTLRSSNNNGLGAAVSSAGTPGKYTSESGMLGYNEICELENDKSWSIKWDDVALVPYISKGNQWVSYDNPRSIAIKVNYAKSKNLAGVMIWSIETEDFHGTCGTKYPILNAIKSALGTTNENADLDPPAENPSKTTAKTTTTTTTTTAKPANNSPGGLCPKEGYVRDPVDCSKFYYCFSVGNQLIPLEQNCSPGLYFDEARITCDYKENVQC